VSGCLEGFVWALLVTLIVGIAVALGGIRVLHRRGNVKEAVAFGVGCVLALAAIALLLFGALLGWRLL
jgi:hypothetical protein